MPTVRATSVPATSVLTPTPTSAERVPVRVSTVRAQFNARAARYGEHDAVMREIGDRLIDRLQYIRLHPARVLDVGSGAGRAAESLAQRFPGARTVAIDVSERMLMRRAAGWRARLPRWLGGRSSAFVNADMARLPIAANAVDLVFSSLALHWHPRPDTVFPEWRRVLRPEGLLLFSCFGPDTLKELRAACRLALPQARPMPFIDMHDFGDMMVASGFANPVMDAEVLTLTYATPKALLSEARALGANPRDDRYRSLPSGRQARCLLDALGAQRLSDGRIGLTFEVAYGHAWKPAASDSATSAQSASAGATSISVDAVRAELAQRRRGAER